ncbi:MAG: hypothetical protein U0838_13145 [Chloroflexota bacterium]
MLDHGPSDGGLSVGQRIGLLETTVIRHGDRIDRLESWQDELRGAMALMKITLGTSIVGGIASIIAIIALLSGASK